MIALLQGYSALLINAWIKSSESTYCSVNSRYIGFVALLEKNSVLLIANKRKWKKTSALLVSFMGLNSVHGNYKLQYLNANMATVS